MANVDGHSFVQLLKSFNLIYICLGRFLYAVGPFRLRFYLHPASCTSIVQVVSNYISSRDATEELEIESDAALERRAAPPFGLVFTVAAGLGPADI